ncbi:MAG: 6,7-dimethyl-8-ribityllumazine synthase [Ignavibacteriae bacterium]|nr:6,7-dimethyl-8-ribityllumazine synthase [Ignavibacteriota bacterium]MCB9217103.1 6,7-dimethyl-8-ribityllumazine synthase [Ignavibacteria bacterium]
MTKRIEGSLSAAGMQIGIVTTRWNEVVTERLLKGALDCLRTLGASADDLTIVTVPGAFEIPVVLRELASSKNYDGLIALGAVIRGDTPHFDYVAGEAASGIARVALETGVPCGFGLLTVDSSEQALERAGLKSGNKGWEAAQTVVETASLLKQLREG